MTLKELKEKVKAVHKIGYNNYKVTIVFRGKEYTCDSNDSMAWDAIEEPSWGSSNILYYTEKQAYQALYDECKRKIILENTTTNVRKCVHFSAFYNIYN